MLIISTFEKWRQEAQEFNVILSVVVSSRPAWVTEDLIFKKKSANTY